VSVKATTWAWEQPTRSSGQRLVLLALADHASEHDDETGYTCWPKISRLSEMTGIGDSQVRAHIGALCDDGLVEKVERKVYGTRAGPNVYRLPVEQRSKTAGGQAVKTAGGQAVKTAGGQAVIPLPEPLQSEPVERTGQLDVLEPWEAMFIQFWESYPRKVAKPAARKSFKTKMSKMTAPQMELMIGGTNAWLAHWELVGTEEQFIPHPATFLNQERYNDHPPQAALPTKQSAVDIIARIAQRDS
jgi:hypothetical protein